MITYPSYTPTHYYVYMFVVDGIPRYIGKGYGRRMHHHEQRMFTGSHTMWLNYLRRCVALNRRVTVEIVADNMTSPEAFLLETQEIMRYGRRRLGEGPLMNYANGGEGHDSETVKAILSRPEVAEKMRIARATRYADPKNREAQRQRIIKMHANPEHKAAHAAAVRAATATEEFKGKISKLSTAMWADPEFRGKQRERCKASMERPECRKALSDRSTESWKRQDVRDRRLAGMSKAANKPGYREKISASMKAHCAVPEVRDALIARMKSFHTDPVMQERITAGVRAAYADPEVRARRKQINVETANRPEVKAAKAEAGRNRKKAATYFGKHYYSTTGEDVRTYLSLVSVKEA